jgi:peptidoglycan/LPS O-acetylase OafA/YrhL
MDQQGGGTQRISALPFHAYGLDLVRLAAALMVALFHFTWTLPSTKWILPVGWVGVPVFFVLSGLVIANSAANATLGAFLRKRFLRLYPAGWICAAISICVILFARDAVDHSGVGAHLSWKRALSSFALFGNVFLTSAYWSLPIEIVFYALVALLVAGRGPRTIVPLGRLLILWAGLFLSLRVGAALGLFPGERLDLGFGLRNVTLLRHGHYFGLGIILYAVARDRSLWRHLAWIGLAVLFAAVEIAWRAEDFAARQGQVHAVLPVALAAFAIWGTLCLAMVASIGEGARSIRPWAARPVRELGLATYPFYLLHETVGGAVLGALLLKGIQAGVAVPAAIGTALLASLAVSLVAEPPLRALLRSGMRFSAGRRAGPADLRPGSSLPPAGP